MIKENDTDWFKKFEKQPFSELLKTDEALLEVHRRFASETKNEKRWIAQDEYNSGFAMSLVDDLLAKIPGEEDVHLPNKTLWPSYFNALAIDPDYAPAILSVGSMEYQIGRVDDAMKLFLSLTKLPQDEEDLFKVIDEVGEFLLDNEEYENALSLYLAAEKNYPNEALFYNCSGFCLAKLGRLKESVEKSRISVTKEPENYSFLNDLGYSLFEIGEYDEAKMYLQKSIDLSPEDYEQPRNNLKRLLAFIAN